MKTESESAALAAVPALTSKQRKRLRGVAHSLKPVVHVGQKGLSDATLAEITAALDVHELIKIRLPSDRQERRELLSSITNGTGADLVGSVGRIAILYRRSEETRKRRVDPGKP